MFVAYHGWQGPVIPMPRRSSFDSKDSKEDKTFRPAKPKKRFSWFRRDSTPRGCREFERKKTVHFSDDQQRKWSDASSKEDMPPPPYYQPKGCREWERSSSIASSASSSCSDAPSLPFLQSNSPTESLADTTVVLTHDDDGEPRLMPLGALHYKRGSVSDRHGKKIASNPMCFCTEHRGNGSVPVWSCPRAMGVC